MARLLWTLLLLGLLATLISADHHEDHGDEENELHSHDDDDHSHDDDDHSHDDDDHSHDDDDHDHDEDDHHDDAHELPFMVKMYEGTYQPATEGAHAQHARVSLTLHYVARAPMEVSWTVQNSDIGLSLTDLSGDRTWQYCSPGDHDTYVCSASMQTSIVRALRIVGAELMHESDNIVLRYYGFNPAAKNFHGVTTPAHKVYLAAPLVVHSFPPRHVHFTVGNGIALRWEVESDNEHELYIIKRKTGASLGEEELYKDDDLDHHHEGETTVTVGSVETKITVTKTTEVMYNFVIELTIAETTADDAGAYVLMMREGMQHWVELGAGEGHGYPSSPVIRLTKKVMGPHIGVVCTAEGHALTDISLSRDGTTLVPTPDEQLSHGSRTEDALAIAYKASINDEMGYGNYSGMYVCDVTSADGTMHAIHDTYVFVAPTGQRPSGGHGGEE